MSLLEHEAGRGPLSRASTIDDCSPSCYGEKREGTHSEQLLFNKNEMYKQLRTV